LGRKSAFTKKEGKNRKISCGSLGGVEEKWEASLRAHKERGDGNNQTQKGAETNPPKKAGKRPEPKYCTGLRGKKTAATGTGGENPEGPGERGGGGRGRETCGPKGEYDLPKKYPTNGKG